MANWYGASRTNYFKVTDEERYQSLFNRLAGTDNEVEDFSTTRNGETYHAFGSYGDILVKSESYDNGEEFSEWSDFLRSVGEILAPDSVFVYTIVGNEKLRYLTGICDMVFPNGRVIHCDLADFAHNSAKQFFGSEYELMLNY